MENPRPEKVAVVEEVKAKLEASDAVVLTEYLGLSVAQLRKLRTSLRDAGGEYKVYKNTLVRFAARDVGLEVEDLLTGPTALAFVTTRPDGTPGDAVGVAKALRSFSQENERLVIKGGVLSRRRLSADEVVELSKIAPREELLARLAGGLAAPMRQFAGLVSALPRDFAYALAALIEQGGASEGAAAAADDTTDTEAPAADDTTDTEAPSADDTTDTEAPAADDTTDEGGDAAGSKES